MERLTEFDVLIGFSFLEAHEVDVDCSDGTKTFATTLKFVNKKNVAIDVDFIDGEYYIGEPYAVTDEYLPLKASEGKE